MLLFLPNENNKLCASGPQGSSSIYIFEALERTEQGVFTTMELFWGCCYIYHLCGLGNGHREEPKITWLFYNTDMLLMLAVAVASASLFYYLLLLPHCGYPSHLRYPGAAVSREKV